jgi:tetratricopeptide (TPR) repeat protein
MTIQRLAPSNRLLYVIIAGLMTAAVGLQVVRDRGWQPYEPESAVMWIRSGPLAQRLALSFDSLAADVYWMRAVLYFGGQRRSVSTTKSYDQLYPLLDLVTSLDPHFRIAYRFGAIFLAEPPPAGPGRADQAVELLQKGLAHDPERWEYAQDIGFVHYWWAGDYEKAAEWFKRAGEIPGGAEWLAPVAAVTLAEGGNRDSSRKLWSELRDSSELEWIRTSAIRRLQQLDAMDAIDELNKNTQQFIARRGRPPADWRELARDQRWRLLPTDPTGTPYTLDPATGKVDLSTNSTLWPLPVGASVGLRK